MTGETIDTSELRALAADLGRVPAATVPAVEQVVKKAAQNVKDDWSRAVSGSARLRHYPRSITYDRRMTVGGVEYEVGPDKDKQQGPLGNIAEFGTSRTGPAKPGASQAMNREAPRFERAVADVVDGLL